MSRRVEYRPVRNLLSRYKYTVPDVRYIAVSEAVRKVMLDSGIAEEAVHTVYDGVDLRRIDAVDETSHVFPDGTRVIGTVGHLSGIRDTGIFCGRCAMCVRSSGEPAWLLSGKAGCGRISRPRPPL